MNFVSLNILSGLTFVLGSAVILFLLWRFYSLREVFKKHYTLLCNTHRFFYIRYIVLAVSCIIALISIFGPQYNSGTQTVSQNGIDVVFVLDVSKSMNVVDIHTQGGGSISRLDFSKLLMRNTILDSPENRYGLVIFAGDAISVSPLTFDHSTFLNFLEHIDYRNLSSQGTNLEKAFALGKSRLDGGDDEEARSQALILLSDGGDRDDVTDVSVIEKMLDSSNIGSIVVGIGSEKGGKIPNGVDVFGRVAYQQYKGKLVISTFYDGVLKKITSSIGGEYIQATDAKALLLENTLIPLLERKLLDVGKSGTYKSLDRYLSFIVAILFLFYLLCIPGRPVSK